MKTIISTLVTLVFFVAPTFVAAGVARPESSGKGHTLAKERRQLPTIPTVDVNSTRFFLSRSSLSALLIFIPPTDQLTSKLPWNLYFFVVVSIASADIFVF